MKSRFLRRFGSLLYFLPSLVAAASAGDAGDFYLCAAVNKNYVIGSKITTVNGVFRLTEQQTWQHVGANDTTLSAVAFDPRDRNVCYTAASNGCWRTLDGGQTWRMTTGWDMTEGRDVVVDPFAPDHVYFALVDGIAHSTDRAQTWTRFEEGLPERGKFTQVLRLDRTKQGRLLAGCESGIYLTENKKWRRVLPTETTVTDIQQSPHHPDHWVAITQSNGTWVSENRGISWRQLRAVPTAHALYSVVYDRRDARRLAIGSWAHGVLTTEDGGQTWTPRNAGLPESPHVWRLGVEPATNRLYASVANQALYVSDDFGRTWRNGGLEGSTVQSFTIVPPAAQR